MVTPGSDGQAGAMTSTPAVTPDRIFELAQGFMASKHLFAASELGLFEALGQGPTDLPGLAARTGLAPRTARISADAMVALGLLERHGDQYANSPVAATFLAGATPADLRPLLTFWDRLSFPAWGDLAGALGRGRPARQVFELAEDLVPVMSAGIEAATAGACRALPAVAGLPAASRVLDIGGGTGSWVTALAQADPELTATVFELPEVAAVARERLRANGLASRIAVVAGDLMHDDLPHGFNAFLLANVILLQPADQRVDPPQDQGGDRARSPAAHRRLLDRCHAHTAGSGRTHGRGVRHPPQRRGRLQRRRRKGMARGNRVEAPRTRVARRRIFTRHGRGGLTLFPWSQGAVARSFAPTRARWTGTPRRTAAPASAGVARR
jgi:hypothetical protein